MYLLLYLTSATVLIPKYIINTIDNNVQLTSYEYIVNKIERMTGVKI